MGTHLSKCFCNWIRQDGTILPRNSKIETILLFFTIFGSAKRKIFTASGGLHPLYPTRHTSTRHLLWTVLDPLGLTMPPVSHLDKAMTYSHCTDRVNTFSYAYWQHPMILPNYDERGLDFSLVPKTILYRLCYTVNIARPFRNFLTLHLKFYTLFPEIYVLGKV